MNKLLKITVIAFVVLNFCGCASYLNYASANSDYKNNPIKIRAQDNGAQVGVDLSMIDVLKSHPFRSIGAALLDIGTGYLIYQYTENNDSHDTTSSGDNGTTIVVSGDNNTINNGNTTDTLTELE
jgi:hypothetical protein